MTESIIKSINICNPTYSSVSAEMIAGETQEYKRGEKGFYFWARKIELRILNENDTIPASLINASSKDRKLSLLHIAVIFVNTFACKYLLRNGANPNAQDYRGWTPAHHAAISLDVSIRAVILPTADLTIKNDLYATVRKLSEFRILVRQDQTQCYWRPKGQQELQEIDVLKYHVLTNSNFLSENHVSSEYLIANWLKPKESNMEGLFPFTPEIAKQYPDFIKKPPKHILQQVETDNSGNLLPFSPGLGLYSHGCFPKHRIVGEYLGFVSTKVKNGPYATSKGWDAQYFSSPSTRINCSFPNVAMMNLPASEEVEGLPCRLIFVSLEDVEGQFCWNYGGHHSVKFGPYIELRPKEMRDFVRNNHVETLLNALLLEMSDRCPDWKTYTLAEQIRYIIQTPIALFTLTLEGLLSEKDADKLVKFGLMSLLLPANPETLTFVDIASKLRMLCQKISEKNPELADQIRFFFTYELPGKLPLKGFLEKANEITKTLKNNSDIITACKVINEILTSLLESSTTEDKERIYKYRENNPEINSTKFEFDEWLKRVFTDVPAQPGTKNNHIPLSLHTYKPQGVTREPQFSSNDPRAVLGLPVGINDMEAIKVQYHKLALKYHPDKTKGKDDIFKKIVEAYQKLVKEINPSPFIVDFSQNLENNFQSAKLYTVELDRIVVDTDVLIDHWVKFIEQLEKISQHPDKENPSDYGLLLDNLLANSKCILAGHQLKFASANEKLPKENLSFEERISFLNEAINRINSWVVKYDLNNENASWPNECVNLYSNAQLLFMDKYLAFHRSLAEVYAANNNRSELFKIRNHVLQTYKERKQLQKRGNEICKQEGVKFLQRLSELSRKENNSNDIPQKESPKKETTPGNEPKQENRQNPQNEKPKLDKDKVPEVKIQPMNDFERNIKKNKQFFSLPKSKVK